MSQGYQLSASAQRQVDDIGRFIAEDSIDAALRVYDALEDAFGRLAVNPGVGHAREDLTGRPAKFFRVFSHLVVCEPLSRPLTIFALLHGARDIEQLLKKIQP